MALYDYVERSTGFSDDVYLAGWSSNYGAVLVREYTSGSNRVLQVHTASDPQTGGFSQAGSDSSAFKTDSGGSYLVGADIDDANDTVYIVVLHGTLPSMDVVSYTAEVWSFDLSTNSWTTEDADVFGGTVGSELQPTYHGAVTWDSVNSELRFVLPAADGAYMGSATSDADLWKWDSTNGSALIGAAHNFSNSFTTAPEYLQGHSVHGESLNVGRINASAPIWGCSHTDGTNTASAGWSSAETTRPGFEDISTSWPVYWDIIDDGTTLYGLSAYDDGTNQRIRLSYRTINTGSWDAAYYRESNWTHDNLVDNTNLDLFTTSAAHGAVGGFDSAGDIHVIVSHDTDNSLEAWKYDTGTNTWDTTPTQVTTSNTAGRTGYLNGGWGRSYVRVDAGTYYLGFPLNHGGQTVYLAEVVIEAGSGGVTLVVQNASHGHSAENVTLTQNHVLSVANSAHAHSAENVVLTQNHVLAVNNSLHGHTAENVTLDVSITLAVQNAAHALTSDEVTLTQNHVLVVADSLHSHTAENVTLTQNHVLSTDNALHSHTAENIDLVENVNLTVQNAAHAVTSDEVVLTQNHVLVVADSTHSQTAENIDLTQNYVLAIDNALHGHVAENVVLTQNHVLDVADALHGHTAENVTLDLTLTLEVQDALHSHTAENVVLTQNHVLDVVNALHGHTAENIDLTQNHVLTVADALHGHTADNVTLDVTVTLEVQNTLHGHTAENVTLTQNHVLVVDDALHAHSAENVTITVEGINLVVQNASHALTSTEVALTQNHVLVVSDALHSQTAENVVLTQNHVLTVADALHSHTSENVVLTQNHVLAVDDSLHSHSAENVTLELGVVLTVQNALHGHTSENVVLTQNHLLVVSDALHGHSADNVDLVENVTLVVADALHSHTAENVTITVGEVVLIVQSAIQSHIAEQLTLLQQHQLEVQNALHIVVSDELNFDGTSLEIAKAWHGLTSTKLQIEIELLSGPPGATVWIAETDIDPVSDWDQELECDGEIPDIEPTEDDILRLTAFGYVQGPIYSRKIGGGGYIRIDSGNLKLTPIGYNQGPLYTVITELPPPPQEPVGIAGWCGTEWINLPCDALTPWSEELDYWITREVNPLYLTEAYQRIIYDIKSFEDNLTVDEVIEFDKVISIAETNPLTFSELYSRIPFTLVNKFFSDSLHIVEGINFTKAGVATIEVFSDLLMNELYQLEKLDRERIKNLSDSIGIEESLVYSKEGFKDIPVSNSVTLSDLYTLTASSREVTNKSFTDTLGPVSETVAVDKVAPPPDPVPTSFTATQNAGACPTLEVNLSWSNNGYSLTKTIEREIAGSGFWSVLDNAVAAGATAYIDNPAIPNNYGYRIKFNGEFTYAEDTENVSC